MNLRWALSRLRAVGARELGHRLVRVTEQLRCAATYHIEISWHFAKECLVRLESDTATVTRDAVELVLRWLAPLTARRRPAVPIPR
jgi:hypothetical protein